MRIRSIFRHQWSQGPFLLLPEATLMTVLIYYHYIYQAFIRWLIAFGAEDGRYTRWKATLPLIALDMWWAAIVGAWIKRIFGYDLLMGQPVTVITISAIGIAGLNYWCLGSKETQESYKKVFLGWSRRKRMVSDWCVVLFMMLTVIFVLYSVSGQWA